jgi:hypothetical protein
MKEVLLEEEGTEGIEEVWGCGGWAQGDVRNFRSLSGMFWTS